MNRKYKDLQSGRADLQSEKRDSKFEGSEKEDFYRDLDKKTSHKSCCTCQTLALLFTVLLLILSGFIFFVYWQVSRGGAINLDFAGKIPTSNFENKISSSNPDLKGQYNIAITEDVLNDILNNGLSIQDFIVKNTTVSINPNSVLIYGQLVSPFSSKIVLTATPKVEDSKIHFSVDKITAGNLNLPAIFNKKVENSLNELFDKKMIKFYQKADVVETNLGENEIIIKGNAKN